MSGLSGAPAYRKGLLRRMRTPPVLPPLLFRQKLLLAVLAGSVFLRDAALGGTFFLLLLFVMKKGERPSRFVLLAAAFLMGLGTTFLAGPAAPPCPSWASFPGRSILAEGRVVSVTGLPGERVRVLLEGLRPLDVFPFMTEKTAEAVNIALAKREDAPYAGRRNYPGPVVEDAASPLRDLVSMTLDKGALACAGRPVQGQTLRALMRLYPVSGSINPGTSDIAAYWADRGIWHGARLNMSGDFPVFLEFVEGEGWAYRAALLRERWRTMMIRALAGTQEGALHQDAPAEERIPEMTQGQAMLTALLFGDRSYLDPETVDLFTRAGLVHSLALSGQHLALAAMAGAAFMFLLSRAWPELFLVRPRRILVVSAGIPFALAYLFLGGAPFSLIRAAFMMLAAAFFLCLRRSVAPMDVLFAAAFLLFLCHPLVAFDLSAQLSVLAVAGILLVMPLVSALLRRFPAKPRGRGKAPFSLMRRAVHAFIRWSGSMLLVSVAAQLAVLPVVVSVFGVISLNLWANLLWLPLLTFITLPGLFAQMPGGMIFSAIFFLLFFLAALTSSISLLEAPTGYLIDHGVKRTHATLIMAVLIFLVGLPSAISLAGGLKIGSRDFIDAAGYLTDSIMMPLASMLCCIFAGWSLKDEKLKAELTNNGTINFPTYGLWKIMMKVIAPAAILCIFATGLKW